MSDVPTPVPYSGDGGQHQGYYSNLTSSEVMMAEIETRMDDAKTGAEAAYAQVLALLNQLLTTVDMNEVWEIVQQGLTPVEFTALSNPFPMTVPTSPTRPSFYALPAIPTMPDLPEFDQDAYTYDSALLQALVATLTNAVQEGGTGFTAAIEAAEAALSQSRLDETLARELANVNAGYAAKGWNLPQGCHIGIEAEIRRQATINATESSNRITIESFKLAQANMWKAREHAIETEKMRSDFIIKGAEAAVRVFEAQLAYIKAWVEENLAMPKIITAYNEDLTRVYEADAKVYEVITKALVDQFLALVSQNKEQSEIDLKMNEISERAGTTLYGVQKELLNSIAKIYSQIAAAWLGSGQISLSGQYHEARQDSTASTVDARVSGSGNLNVNYNINSEA